MNFDENMPKLTLWCTEINKKKISLAKKNALTKEILTLYPYNHLTAKGIGVHLLMGFNQITEFKNGIDV
jgi:hypothetical protein